MTLPDTLRFLLLFAILIVAPLALNRTLAASDRPRARRFYFPTALSAVLSLLLRPGDLAAVLALPWLLFTGLVALTALRRLASRPFAVEAACVDFGLLYLPIGAVWLLFARWGRPFIGFTDPLLTLTAVHFHYISLGALVLTGMAGRRLREANPDAYRLYRPAAFGIIVAPLLIALGITYSTILEGIAALLLVLSLAAVALLTLRFIVPKPEDSTARILLTISSLSVLLSMGLAAVYAAGRLLGESFITIPTMVQTHGWLNAIGFTLCGLLAWRQVAYGRPESL